VNPASPKAVLEITETSAPRNQFQIRSLYDLSRRLEFDSSLAYVGDLPNSANGFTPRYARLDARIGWHLGESTELSLVGQNLLTPRHIEFSYVYPVNPVEIERSVFGRIAWRF
jgi:outer membrane receptor for monomeric catechols